MRKILISRGYGSGWTTCNSGSIEFLQWLLTHKEVIEYLESGNEFTREDACGGKDYSPTHPILIKLEADAKEMFGKEYMCTSGAVGLRVKEVGGPVKIKDHDGNEYIDSYGDDEYL